MVVGEHSHPNFKPARPDTGLPRRWSLHACLRGLAQVHPSHRSKLERPGVCCRWWWQTRRTCSSQQYYVGRMGCHIHCWSARWCRTHLGYTRKVKYQMGIFQITTLVHLQGTIHWSMYKSSATTDHISLTHGIRDQSHHLILEVSTIWDWWQPKLPGRCQPEKISLHLKHLN